MSVRESRADIICVVNTTTKIDKNLMNNFKAKSNSSQKKKKFEKNAAS